MLPQCPSRRKYWPARLFEVHVKVGRDLWMQRQATQGLLIAAAVAAAEEAEATQGDDDAASTAALDYMESPNMLNSSAAGAGSHSSVQDLAAPYSSAQDIALPAEQPQQAEEAHPADLPQQTEAAHPQQMGAAETAVADVHAAIVPASNHHDNSGEAVSIFPCTVCPTNAGGEDCIEQVVMSVFRRLLLLQVMPMRPLLTSLTSRRRLRGAGGMRRARARRACLAGTATCAWCARCRSR